MNLRWARLTVALGILAASVAQASDNPTGFGLGQYVEYCLTTKCQVFRGSLETDSDSNASFIGVRVEEVLFGPPADPPLVPLPYTDPRRFVKSDVGLSTLAWGVGGEVPLVKGTPVIVGVALERIRGLNSGVPVFVISNLQMFDTIRSLASAAVRTHLINASLG